MTTYRDAGVDREGADRHVSAISAIVASTWDRSVVGKVGDFASGIEVPTGYRRPVLMMSTDGVGTKLELARQAGMWDGVGFDLVAMCVDDLAAVGARPLGLVDYMAVGGLQQERDRAIIASLAAACSRAGCALLGGETAEHPGVMAPDAVDLAGAVVGIVEKGEELGGHLVEEGDDIVGLSSPNLRSNGFSLVRAALGDDAVAHADVLLQPSVIYSPVVLEAVAAGGVHAAAHVTGGGIAANLARVMPDGLGAWVDTSRWDPPRVFSLVASYGVSPEEMLTTFNMGIGFLLVVDPRQTDAVLSAAAPHRPVVLGKVEPGRGARLQ